MRIIHPVTVDGAVLVSSNVLETDYAEWSAGTAYTVGQRCIVAAQHLVFEALVAHTNANPLTDTSTPPKWLEVGATNRWRMFDQAIGSVTSRAEEVDVTLAPGLVNAVAFFGLSAGTVTLTMMNGATEVYARTVELVSPLSESSFYAYCFDPITRRSDVAVWDLPAYPSATLRVQVTQPGGTAAVGLLVVGMQRKLGDERWSPKFGIEDYSKKKTDEFGVSSFKERAFAKLATVSTEIRTQDVDVVHARLAAIRAKPVVWDVGGFEAGLIFGRYRSFSVVVPYVNVSYCDLEIEGLT